MYVYNNFVCLPVLWEASFVRVLVVVRSGLIKIGIGKAAFYLFLLLLCVPNVLTCSEVYGKQLL